MEKKNSLDAPWYIGPEWRGVRYKACLFTAHRATAELKAEELCYLVWNDRIAEFRAKLKGTAKVESRIGSRSGESFREARGAVFEGQNLAERNTRIG